MTRLRGWLLGSMVHELGHGGWAYVAAHDDPQDPPESAPMPGSDPPPGAPGFGRVPADPQSRNVSNTIAGHCRPLDRPREPVNRPGAKATIIRRGSEKRAMTSV